MNLDHFEDFDIVPAAIPVAKSHPYSDGWRVIRSIYPDKPYCTLLFVLLSSEYRGYEITYDPPPIPSRDCDWSYVHKDYDGTEDANDNRAGHARSWDACLDEIDALEDRE